MDINFSAVGLPDEFCCDHFFRFPRPGNSFFMQKYDRMAKGGGGRQIMQNHNDRELSLSIELMQEMKNGQLVIDIKMRVWLVKQENGGLLRNSPCDQDPLSFTA